jgi:hypothetical protein
VKFYDNVNVTALLTSLFLSLPGKCCLTRKTLMAENTTDLLLWMDMIESVSTLSVYCSARCVQCGLENCCTLFVIGKV